MTQEERDHLAHLANDWDAQAAELERGTQMMYNSARAKVLRSCAGDLRDRLLRLRAPVPHVIREGTLVSWGPVLNPPWPSGELQAPG